MITPLSDDSVRDLAERASDRLAFWPEFINRVGINVMAEVGVYRGGFAHKILDQCPAITRYFMIDPWRHLDDWNKPANKNDTELEQIYATALTRTDAFAEKRVILRGRTLEVIDQIGDSELDFAYIDGDHTLRGITIDLIRVYPKIRDGGYLGGDDFSRNIFQHSTRYEPTLVFPYVLYFAEAVGARVFAVGHRQFLIQKSAESGFEFVDLVGKYSKTTLKSQFNAALRRKTNSAQARETPRSRGVGEVLKDLVRR